MLKKIFINIIVFLLVQIVVVLVYCLRRNSKDFDINLWLNTNRTRFIVATIVSISLSILMVISTEVGLLLKGIGINADATPIGISLILGGVLIGVVKGNKLKGD